MRVDKLFTGVLYLIFSWAFTVSQARAESPLLAQTLAETIRLNCVHPSADSVRSQEADYCRAARLSEAASRFNDLAAQQWDETASLCHKRCGEEALITLEDDYCDNSSFRSIEFEASESAAISGTTISTDDEKQRFKDASACKESEWGALRRNQNWESSVKNRETAMQNLRKVAELRSDSSVEAHPSGGAGDGPSLVSAAGSASQGSSAAGALTPLAAPTPSLQALPTSGVAVIFTLPASAERPARETQSLYLALDPLHPRSAAALASASLTTRLPEDTLLAKPVSSARSDERSPGVPFANTEVSALSEVTARTEGPGPVALAETPAKFARRRAPAQTGYAEGLDVPSTDETLFARVSRRITATVSNDPQWTNVANGL